MATRGRPRSGIKDDTAIAQGAELGNPRDPNKSVRPPRVRMQQGENLSILGIKLDNDNFYHRWFQEDPTRPGRVDAAKAAYYEPVKDDEGNAIVRNSGAGKMHLMRIPLEYRLEDEAVKREQVKRTLGEQTKLGPNEYAPDKRSADGGESSMVDHQTTDNPYA
jgi:hypothetical protein